MIGNKPMNGKEQMEAMARLAEPCQPDELAGFRVGDAVRLPRIECPLKVIALQPPSILILESPAGHQLRAGWRACAKVRTRADQERQQ